MWIKYCQTFVTYQPHLRHKLKTTFTNSFQSTKPIHFQHHTSTSNRSFISNQHLMTDSSSKTITAISALVSPSWLCQRMASVTILDASWYMPSAKRDPNAEFLQSRIPGAQRFDIDSEHLSDQTTSLPHMLPTSPNHFQIALSNLGVFIDRPVVLYAQNDFVGAARAWWMFRVYGKNDVFVLNGGLDAWKRKGFPVSKGQMKNIEKPDGIPFISNYNPQLVKQLSQILHQIKEQKGFIIDARSNGRFHATTPEPRPGLMSGHMPGAYNLPSADVMNNDGTLKNKQDLEKILTHNLGLSIHQLKNNQVTLTCGSGVTAAIIGIALYELGITNAAVYDGSWSEYGMDHNRPVAT